MTEIPFLDELGDALEVAIVAQTRRASQLRGRRHRRTAAIVAATGAVALLVAAPAIGLRGHIVRLLSAAPPAPQRVVESLTSLDQGLPANLHGGSRAVNARKVLDEPVGFGQRALVWIAPRVGGGFCSLLELQRSNGTSRGGGAECVPLLAHRLSFDTTLRGDFSPSGKILSGPVLINGWVSLTDADSVAVQFEGGGAIRLPFVWVTEPVNAGFFVYGVPPEHWRPGNVPAVILVRNAAGKEIAHEPVTGIDLRAAFPPPKDDR